jgi:hypothetical protein
MITWHPHTDVPAAPETAVIAINLDNEETGLPEPILVPGLYRFDVRMGVWIDEITGLLLHHKEFKWAAEDDILRTLP